jgi:hypothetical protein
MVGGAGKAATCLFARQAEQLLLLHTSRGRRQAQCAEFRSMGQQNSASAQAGRAMVVWMLCQLTVTLIFVVLRANGSHTKYRGISIYTQSVPPHACRCSCASTGWAWCVRLGATVAQQRCCWVIRCSTTGSSSRGTRWRMRQSSDWQWLGEDLSRPY